MDYVKIIPRLAVQRQAGNTKAGAVLKRVFRHRKLISRRKRHLDILNIEMERANIFLDTIASGGIVAAIDLENSRGIIRQIGLTFFQQTTCRTLATININIKGARLGTVFNHGQTIYMTMDEARLWLPRALENVSCIVGHNFITDLGLFRENDFTLPEIPYFDTVNWFNVLARQAIEAHYNPSLTSLCALLKIEFSNAHNAGNDARATMLCALKSRRLIGEWLDSLNAREAPR